MNNLTLEKSVFRGICDKMDWLAVLVKAQAEVQMSGCSYRMLVKVGLVKVSNV